MQADKRNGENSAVEGSVRPKLDTIAASVGGGAQSGGGAPVHLWDPPLCGDLDMRIRRDGVWLYQGSPITREPLARLFGRILRKDEDGDTYLVTPVEKFRILVEDAPFVGVDLDAIGAGEAQRVEIETNHADRVTLGPDHPLRLAFDAETGEPAPYILIRGRLEARLDRKSFFRLADLAVESPKDRGADWGVWSCGAFFSLGAG